MADPRGCAKTRVVGQSGYAVLSATSTLDEEQPLSIEHPRRVLYGYKYDKKEIKISFVISGLIVW